MVVCTFFNQGYCRYGASCRFEHQYNTKYSYRASQSPANSQATTAAVVTDEQLFLQVRTDIQSALSGKQWILSCYMPYKEKPNFPGITDHSPEEVRLAFYEAKANNSIDQAVRIFNSLVQDAEYKYKKLLEPDEATKRALRSLYNGEIPQNPFASSQKSSFSSGDISNSNQATSIFRSGSQSIFGGSAATSNSSPGIFGGQNQTPSVFGGQTSPASVFGGQTSPASVFGGQTTPGSVFGGQTTPASVFGGQTSPASVFVGQTSPASVFGGQTSPASVFGGQTSPASVFGGQSSQASAFGGQNQTPSVFGTQSPAQAQSIFAQANQNLSAQHSFGSAPQTLFSSQKSQPNAFQQNEQSQSPFGHIQPQVPNVFQQASGFPSGQPSATGNIFGQQPVIEDESVVYSKMEDLSQSDLDAFNSDSFKLGFIPEIPPPRALCCI